MLGSMVLRIRGVLLPNLRNPPAQIRQHGEHGQHRRGDKEANHHISDREEQDGDRPEEISAAQPTESAPPLDGMADLSIR